MREIIDHCVSNGSHSPVGKEWIYLWRLNSIYGVNKRVQSFVAPSHPGRVISSAHEWSVKQ